MITELFAACLLSLLPTAPAEAPAACAAPADSTADAAPATQPTTQPTGITKVDAEQFDKLRADANAVVVDVRTTKEFEAGHLPGAINIPVTDKTFDAEVAKLDKGKTYLVHCKTGKRSDVAVHKMQSMGFTTLYDLTGGYVAWTNAGKPTEK